MSHSAAAAAVAAARATRRRRRRRRLRRLRVRSVAVSTGQARGGRVRAKGYRRVLTCVVVLPLTDMSQLLVVAVVTNVAGPLVRGTTADRRVHFNDGLA
jgi:hypothetical protein